MYGLAQSLKRFYVNYANFEGRAMRSEYWLPLLFQMIVYVLLTVMLFRSDFSGIFEDENLDREAYIWFGCVGIFYLANLLPGLAVKTRRFHDLGQSGWWVVAFIGGGILFPYAWAGQMVWFAMKGTDGSNAYGPNPVDGGLAEIFG